MKFDIIDALKQARDIVGHECTINCSLNGTGYLIQIKVVVPPVRNTRGSRIYGQQIAFTEHEVIMDEWYITNDKFQQALEALRLQIQGDNNDNGSL